MCKSTKKLKVVRLTDEKEGLIDEKLTLLKVWSRLSILRVEEDSFAPNFPFLNADHISSISKYLRSSKQRKFYVD